VNELFRVARDYHGAVAAYCHALAGLESFGNLENLDDLENLKNLENLENLENLTQDVLGASLRYRAALDRLIGGTQAGSNEAHIGRRRLAALRSMLHFTSKRYNALAKVLHVHHPVGSD
jgi:hypothetical protein